ncbi:MAG: hypothetical protein GF411_02755 [Candidatus Lokiarchaeota archaeon]|nr:hypothetical protein [Candidatus Lokiarchaeota archaeon]
MSYSLPEMPTLNEIITEILEHIINGWRPIYDEEHVYQTGTTTYNLIGDGSNEVDIHDIIRVNGTYDGSEYTFTSGTDYTLTDTTGNDKFDSIIWDTGETVPDDGTKMYISYRYQITSTGLTDITEGSVLRTTVESVGIQIYRTFLKLQEVGRDSYVDTAIGTRLDLLGTIVGVTRNPATRTTGYITIRRDSTSTGSTITIPIGTQFATVGTSTSPAVFFQTTKTARIRSGETSAVVYTSSSDPDYLQAWIPVECISLGDTGNVSSGSIIRNITAPSAVTYVNNPSTYDVVGEQITGDGSSQVFDLAHPPSSVSSRGGKYIQYKHGYISQPSSATTIKLTLNHSGDDYDNTSSEQVDVTIYGEDNAGNSINETEVLHDAQLTRTTTNSFAKIFYVTFANNTGGGGIGEGIGDESTITIENGAATETYLDAQAPGERVDGGYLDMIADDAYISLYIWESDSWQLQSIGTTGSGTDNYHYVDSATGSFEAGVIYWNDGLGGGSTWTGSDPYYSNYAAGPNADGENIRIEYYPIAGQTGTGDATDISSGITAFTVTKEYKYGWIDSPSSASSLSFSCTDSGGSDASWDGTIIVHGTTTTGGIDDEEALVFDSSVPDYEKSTSKEFSRIDYITCSNANNPAEGFGEGSASSTYLRVGTTTKGSDLMGISQCGTRVDSGFLSLIGIDSDTTLKVYVYDSGWTLKTQADSHYSYSSTGTNAGMIDWGSTWDWSTSPYVNDHAAGPFTDGRNIMIEYVPITSEYSVNNDQLSLEGAPTNSSVLSLSYTWQNTFTDGSDIESDTAFRRRIKTAISSSAKGTLSAIESAVLDVDNVEGVVVSDYSTDPTIDIGEVHVFAWTNTGLLDGGTRSLVADAVRDTRAAGVKPVVQSPTPIYIAIHVTVKVDSSISRTTTAVKEDIEDAIVSYINGLGINRAMYKSELLNIIEGISEVAYVDVSTLEVWGYNTNTSTTVSTVTPYTTSPYWYFDEGTTQDWSASGNVIYVNSGYVLRADTDDSDSSSNKAIDVTVEYI